MHILSKLSPCAPNCIKQQALQTGGKSGETNAVESRRFWKTSDLFCRLTATC